jgi:hypothetical protein
MNPDKPAHLRSLIRIHGVRLPTLLQVEKLIANSMDPDQTARIFRNYELIFLKNEIIFRKKELIFRNYELIFRNYELIFRKKKLIIIS